MKNLMMFEDKNINVILNEEGNPMFELYSTGMALGFVRANSKGKLYARKDRIDNCIENAEILVCDHDGHKYLSEENLYDFMLEARTDKCKPFRKWVTNELLPQLRKTGVVIMEHAEEETIDFEKKYGTYRIRKTFINSVNIVSDYEEFKTLSANEWKSKRLNNDDRIKLSKLIKKGLEDKIRANMMSMKPSELLGCQELMTSIQEDITKLENNKRGGKLAAATKEKKKLEQALEELINREEDNIENYSTINMHGFSVNYMYEYNHYLNRPVKTYAYKKWIEEFNHKYMLDCLSTKEDLEIYGEIDFTKPIEIFIKYVAKKESDIENFNKSFIDMLFNRIFEVDDNIVDVVHSERVGTCSNYNEGSISFYIRNK